MELEGYVSKLCCQPDFLQRVGQFLYGFLLSCMSVPEGASDNVVCGVHAVICALAGWSCLSSFSHDRGDPDFAVQWVCTLSQSECDQPATFLGNQ